MTTTTSRTKGRIRLQDNTRLFNRWLDTLAQRSYPSKLPDGLPTFPANPDGGFHDIATALTNLAFLAGRLNTLKTTVAAGGSSPQVIMSAAGGTLTNILVTATGSVALNFYDNASAATGDIVGSVPTTATVGQLFPCNSGKLANGLVAGHATGTPAVTVTYTTA